MSKHTSGPWKVYKHCVLTDCPNAAEMLKAGTPVTTRRICVAEPSHYVLPEQNEANLRLIVAAPDYFEAVELMIANEDVGGTGWWKAWDKVKAAHAKAVGDSMCQTCNGSGMPGGVSGYPCPECSRKGAVS